MRIYDGEHKELIVERSRVFEAGERGRLAIALEVDTGCGEYCAQELAALMRGIHAKNMTDWGHGEASGQGTCR